MKNLVTIRTALALGLALGVTTTGCKWTEFDDLEKDTWVGSTGKPNGDSTDYGVAIQRGQNALQGGKLVAIGAGQAQYTELVYSPNGDADLAPTALKLNTQFGIGNLDTQPLLLADPTGDEVALVVNSGGQSIAVLTGSGGLIAHQIFGPEQPDAATYMIPPAREDMPAAPTPAQVLVAAGDSVYGAFIANVPNPQTKCQLKDETGQPVTIRGVGAVRFTGASDDVAVWATTAAGAGKLLVYPGAVFNGTINTGTCTGGSQVPLAGSVPLETPFAPAKGSQIVMIAGRFALLVGHKDVGNSDSFLGLYDLIGTDGTAAGSPAMVGAPITLPELRTATVLDLGTMSAPKRFVVAGYPTATFDGEKAGRVLVFPLDVTTGIDSNPKATLNDASPQSDQQFGRAVAVLPFNGQNVIAVAADNEVFVYFRVGAEGSVLYGETRTGQ